MIKKKWRLSEINKIVLLLIFWQFNNNIIGQIPSIIWQRCYNDKFGFLDVVQSKDNNYVVVGYANNYYSDSLVSQGGMDVLVTKLNSAGEIIWEKTIGGGGNDWARSISNSYDEGYIITGVSDSIGGDVTNNNGDFDCWVIKLRKDGLLEWQKSFGGKWFDEGSTLIQTYDSGFLVGGITHSTDGDVKNNKGVSDVWLLRLDKSGTLLWSKTFGGTNYEEIGKIIETKDKGYLITAMTYSRDKDVSKSFGNGDIWVFKINDTGHVLWEHSYGGTGYEYGARIALKNDNGFYLACQSKSNDKDVSNNYGGFDFWILSIDSIGRILWEKSYGGSMNEFVNGIASDLINNVYIAGFTRSTDKFVIGNHRNYDDYWVIKLRQNGELEWQKCLGGNHDDRLTAMIKTQTNELVLIGYATYNSGDVTGNYSDVSPWVVKLEVFSKISALIQFQNNKNQNSELRFFPNPGHDYIVFENIKEGDIELTFTDIAGFEYKFYYSHEQEGDFILPTVNLPSGLFIITIILDNKIWKYKWIKV